MKKTILLDNIIFELQKYGGITNVWKSILIASEKCEVYKFVYLSNSKPKHNYIAEKNLPILIRRFLNVNTKGVDLFHSSYFRIHSSSNVKTVLTVHDFTYEKYDNRLWSNLHLIQKQYAIRKASAIICVSENTKRDLLRYHGSIIQNKKVKVIRNGFSNNYFRLSNTHIDKSLNIKKYILFVGSRSVHKNFDYVLRIIISKYCMVNKIKLFVVGPNFSKLEIKKLDEIGASDRVKNLGFIEDRRLNQLYNSALALVYPSLYEGFGIPVLEAMAAGCPVILSNNSSLPEVGGEAGLYIDPKSVDDSLKHLESLKNKSFRNKVINNGLINSNKYSWAKTGKETLNFYREVLGC